MARKLSGWQQGKPASIEMRKNHNNGSLERDIEADNADIRTKSDGGYSYYRRLSDDLANERRLQRELREVWE